MNEILSFKELGIKEDEVEIDFVEEEDGTGRLDLQFKSYVAGEVFRAACERAGLPPEEYLRRLLDI